MTYGAILKEGETFYTDLGKVFQAIGNVQTEYNWLITDCDCYPCSPDVDRLLSQDYCWLSGEELTAIVQKENLQWIWAVISGFPKEISLDDILKYPLPYAEQYQGVWKTPLFMQHPLAKIEIVPWDASLTLILSDQVEMIDSYRKFFTLSEDLSLYNKRQLKNQTIVE